MSAGVTIDDLIDVRLDELATITEQLVDAYSDTAELTIHLKSYTSAAWLNAEGSTTERNHRVTYETYVPQDGTPAYGAELTRREADIRALTERRDHLRLLLEHRR